MKSLTTHSALPGIRIDAIARILRSLVALQNQRDELKNMEDWQLRDLGLSRDETVREARRPFWDLPGHWRD